MAEGLRTWSARHRFGVGLLCGVFSVFGAREIINQTTLVDRLMSPLVLADTGGQGDAIVALGASVVGPCVPNLNSFRRVALAAQLWREGRAPFILFAGGPHEQSCKVSQAMANLARLMGVPDTAIRVETESRSTHENAVASAGLLRALGLRRIVAVTDRLHMRRAQAVFQRLGFTVERASVPIYEGHPDNVSMLYWGTREMIANTYYWMRGWTGPEIAGPVATRPTPASAWAPQVARFPQGPIVILGASYAGGWDLKSVSGVEVLNRGVAGEQSFEMLARFERDVVAAQPRLVVIWGFINDISRSAPETMDASLERIRESYTQMISSARQQGIPVVLATELTIRPRDTWTEWAASIVGGALGKLSYQDRVNAHVIDVNRWLLEFAAREHLPVLRFQELLSDENGRRRRDFIQDDGSHVTAAAYAALTAYARPILEEHVVTR